MKRICAGVGLVLLAGIGAMSMSETGPAAAGADPAGEGGSAAGAEAAPARADAPATPKVRVETVEYRDGETVLEGYLAYPEGATGPRPGVLVAHAWRGVDDYTRGRARQLAGMGYVAFALDVYGKGVRAESAQQARTLSNQYKDDRPALRRRARLGLDVLAGNPRVDRKRIAAIGYCFGGTTVLELARSGADLAGVVSFHGGLDTPTPADARNIRCKVLILHAGADSGVTPEHLRAVWKELADAKVDHQIVIYGGAVHGFTEAPAEKDAAREGNWNQLAERRSWQAMKAFFAELFE